MQHARSGCSKGPELCERILVFHVEIAEFFEGPILGKLVFGVLWALMKLFKGSVTGSSGSSKFYGTTFLCSLQFVGAWGIAHRCQQSS